MLESFEFHLLCRCLLGVPGGGAAVLVRDGVGLEAG